MLDSDICRYTFSVTDIFANKTGSLPEKRLFPRPAPSSPDFAERTKKKLQISTGTRRAHPPEIQITTINHCFYHPFGRRRALAVVCLLSFRFISEISFLSPPRDGPSSWWLRVRVWWWHTKETGKAREIHHKHKPHPAGNRLLQTRLKSTNLRRLWDKNRPPRRRKKGFLLNKY